MAISNETNVAFVFKKNYMDEQVGDVAARVHPIMNKMSKRDGMVGEAATHTYFVRYGNPQGVAGAFSSAQSAVSTSKGVQFVCSRKDSYGVIKIDGPSLSACSGKGAIYDLVTMESDGIIEERGDAHAHQMWGNGYAVLGQRSSLSTNTITLTQANTARNFKVGMSLVTDNTEAGTSLLDSGASTTVTKVDEDANTVTVADYSGQWPSGSDDDYFFRLGDPESAIDGFESIIPLTAPSGGESFRGQDRTAHTRLLAGSRVDDTATSILENAGIITVKIAEASARAGAKDKILALSPANFWAVSRELNAKVEYNGAGGSATAMFSGFDIATPAGVVRAVSDPHAPANRGRIMAMDCWHWKHLKPWIHVIRDDKNAPAMRVADADQIEIRIRSMGNLVCSMPAANGVFSI